MPELLAVNKNLFVEDAWQLDVFKGTGGYERARRALTEMSPEDLIAMMEASGLKGRGGAFFPTGMKWKFVRADPNTPRYVIANGDESEPGTFCNRFNMELDPHLFIEGMIIAAYAVDSHFGYIYIRGEYGRAIERVEQALADCYADGILGDDVLGSGYKLDLRLRRGAGAYICGEETALFNSLEGKRGNPRFKPPFPTNSGVWRKPTVINNIETFACVPLIVENGAEWFQELGEGDENAGTKIYCLSGVINNPGVYELPMGVTARELIYEYGGGLPEGRTLKGFKPGGASAAILTSEQLDVRLDPSIAQYDTIMGTGGVIVMDETVCMVDAAYRDALFFEEESCGFCIPCREGTPNLVQILERLMHGQGVMADLQLMEEIGDSMASSFCGLGQFAYRPVVGAAQKYRDEFVAHVEGSCPAGSCAIANN
ncbi:MAG: NADH-quinone oxidoreductase subunit NuoF [Chloroflexi bacterium]|nr:NADH-quinone oxidoreductase subunit NuoF [Chloroflexota bacterium]MCY3938900.1 NADH-quinone oxidoreductase subunit NuoF [Chloroflexota bacterium]